MVADRDPLAILILVRIPEFTSFRSLPGHGRWVRRGEILGYGAVADLVVLAAVVGILARRAWLSISALALDERGYGQNHAARQRAADLVADGYHGFISGHTHHPELAATAAGFYANSGSCTSVVEGIGGRFGLPPAYVRNQQICWVELAAGQAELVSARVELAGATRMERFVARGRNPHSDIPVRVACWPTGPDWPPADSKADSKKPRPALAPPCPGVAAVAAASASGPKRNEPGSQHPQGHRPGFIRYSPAGRRSSAGSAAFGCPGLLDGELGGGVGFQALVGDRVAAADGPAVGAVIQPVQRPLDGLQPARAGSRRWRRPCPLR